MNKRHRLLVGQVIEEKFLLLFKVSSCENLYSFVNVIALSNILRICGNVVIILSVCQFRRQMIIIFLRRRVLVRLPATSFVPGKGNKTTKIPQKRGKSKIPNFACTSNDALVLCVFFSSNCKVLLQYSATSDWKITKYLFLTVLLIGLMLIKLQIGCSKYLWSLYVCLFDVAFVLKKSH